MTLNTTAAHLTFLFSLAAPQQLTGHTVSLTLKYNSVAKSFDSLVRKEMSSSFVPFRHCLFTFFMYTRGCASNLIQGLCQIPKIETYQPEKRGRTRSEAKSGV